MLDGNDDRKIRREKMMQKMGEMKNKLKPVLIISMVLLVIGGVWYSYDQFFSYAGVTSVAVVNMRNIEISERYGEHTTIWADNALGDKTFKYTLIGIQELDIDSTYRITYVNRVKILPFSLRIALWG